jgi:hypothetical protein
MKLFGRKEQNVVPVCKICGLEFADADRMIRHMAKAHSKPCGDGKCGCS